MNYETERTVDVAKANSVPWLAALIFSASAFVATTLWLVLKQPALTLQSNAIVKILLALDAAVIGLTIGFKFGVIIRAAGSMALFLAVIALYSYRPPLPVNTSFPVSANLRVKGNPSTLPADVQPQGWHKTDEAGNPYEIVWLMDPVCRELQSSDTTRQCRFERTQHVISGDNTPFDHWHLELKAPGPVYDVQCQPTGSNEFIEVRGDSTELTPSDVAQCSGWINGGDAAIKMTVRYMRRW